MHKSDRILRLVLSVVLPICFYIGCNFIKVSSIIWLIPFTFVLVLIYCLPHLITLYRIKNRLVSDVKSVVIDDLLYYLLPFVAVSFFAGLILYLFFEQFKHVFMLTIVLVAISFFTCFVFWISYLFYAILSKKDS